MSKIPCVCRNCGSAFSVYPSRIADGRGIACSRRCANVLAAAQAVAARPTLEQRFWAQVDRQGPDDCWPWLGTKLRGYGRIKEGNRARQAHQVAWEIANGEPFPVGMFGCHSCDNPPCCNPAHIWPGTSGENLQDASEKGRLGLIVVGRKCRAGHVQSPEVIRHYTGRDRCGICVDEYHRRSMAKREAAHGL